MVIYNRIKEAETQINSLRNGFSKLIPLSILKLFTCLILNLERFLFLLTFLILL